MKRTYIKATKQIKSETPKGGEPIEIKRLNVFEFWKYFDFWRERMSKRIEANRKNNR